LKHIQFGMGTDRGRQEPGTLIVTTDR